jgi:hypothetical protein
MESRSSGRANVPRAHAAGHKVVGEGGHDVEEEDQGGVPVATSPLHAVFYAEFDNALGPKIVYQAPEGCVAGPQWEAPAAAGCLSPSPPTPFHSPHSLTPLLLPHQHPRSFLTPEDFESIADYMITEPDLCGRVIGVEEAGVSRCPRGTVLGYPVTLRGDRYARNALLFSVGFVLDATTTARSIQLGRNPAGAAEGGGGANGGASSAAAADTFAAGHSGAHTAPPHSAGDGGDETLVLSPYHAVLEKFGQALTALEVESAFLSRPDRKARLASVLPAVLRGLSTRGECLVPLDACDTLALKLFPALPAPAPVRDHDVPVPLRDLDALVGPDDSESGWDLALRALVPLMDGVATVAAIAAAADVDPSIARRAVQHLVFYGLVSVADVFQFSNIYATTQGLQGLLHRRELRAACVRYVSREDGVLGEEEDGEVSGGGDDDNEDGGGDRGEEEEAEAEDGAGRLQGRRRRRRPSGPSFEFVFRLFTAFGAGARVCDVCAQNDAARKGVDERRLVVFGVVHGLLRRVHKYPVRRDRGSSGPAAGRGQGVEGKDEGGGHGLGPLGSGWAAGRAMPALPAPASDSPSSVAADGLLASPALGGGAGGINAPFRLPSSVVGTLDGSIHLEELCVKYCVSQAQLEAAIDALGSFVYVLR